MARKIENKAFKDLKTSQAETYAQLLKVVIQRPLKPEAGFQYEEMRKTTAIDDALEAAGDAITLEDDHYELLRKKLHAFPFGLAHKELLQLYDDVDEAEKIEITAKS